MILITLLINQTSGQEKCATAFNPDSLSQEQLDKLQLFNARVRMLHQNRLSKSEDKQSLLLANEAIILIPVVVHVIWNTATDNLSEVQIRSQIDVLNEDFRRINTDADDTPVSFEELAGDARVQFYLACEDPNGNPTNGITRTQTNVTAFNPDTDNMKFSSSGGKNAWNTSMYLNIWVCDLLGSSLGYAQFPEEFTSNPNTDGVVIIPEAFGRNSSHPIYNLGRTATHEVGHWAGLYHIWSKTGADNNTSCSDSDEISDTPNQADANYGCPSFPSPSCGNSSDMFMNYMDYSNDACMNMFTRGQIIRMRANFETGGFRDYFQHQTISSYIAGNEAICTAVGSYYSIADLPAGTANFQWQVGPHLNIISGEGTNNAQIETTLNGLHRETWVIGSFTLTCYGRIYIRKEVYTNTPYPNYIISDPTPPNGIYCTNTFYKFNAMFHNWDQEGLIDSYEWSISPNTYNDGSTTRQLIAGFSAPGYYTITVRAIGACGLSLPAEFYCQVQRCPRIGIDYVVAPNPANNTMTIMFRETQSQSVNSSIISRKTLEISLYNNTFRMLRSAQTAVGNDVTFNTSDLTAGIYYLHISDGSTTDVQQVLIQH